MVDQGSVEIRVFDDDGSARMLQAFADLYTAEFLQTEEGQQVARAEIHERQHWFQERYAPWIESVRPLLGARVLEVGSGSGSSTVGFALAGATVDAVDMSSRGQSLAVLRAELHGVRQRIEFHVSNATEIEARFGGNEYDIIAYIASLEHMTFDERTRTLRSAWAMLQPGGLLVIADTPNRLWYYDDHTTFENFFHWLPDDVAAAYALRVTRTGFTDDMHQPDALLRLARWGRGVSYHDLTIALDDDATKYFVSGEWEYRRRRDPDYASWWATTTEGKFHETLKAIAPTIPSGFLETELAICLRKPPPSN